MANDHVEHIRIVQETVAGKEITFAHVMGGPAPVIYQKLGLNPQVDYRSSAIGIMNMTPPESAVIASDIAVKSGNVKKGDVLGVARVAGIMGVKRTSELIPMCHPLPIQKCSVDFETDEDAGVIRVFCTVKTEGKTGVEMEALTGVQVTLLTIYDMCKAIDKHMVMSDIHLEEKTGGKSGDFRFEEK